MTKKQKEKVEAIEYLKQHIKAGDTLYTKLEKVSSSGMSRQIKVLDIKDETPSYWSYYVSKILGYTLKDNGALVVKGCGLWIWGFTLSIHYHKLYSMMATQLNKGGSNGYIYISNWYPGSYWSSLSFASNNRYNQR
jgi:hypothetical protein